MLNLNDKSVSDIINSNKTELYYVATSGDKLYYTNYYTHTVTCCDIHGTTQWEFRDERVLQYPYGNSNAIVVFNINCIISIGSCLIFTYLE
jgi:hypothetical protein